MPDDPPPGTADAGPPAPQGPPAPTSGTQDGVGQARPGLAGERTSLAWTRTVLAILVAGALLLRTDAGLGGVGELPGAVTIAAALLLLAVTLRRGPDAASPTLLRAIGIGVTLLCLASLALTLAEL